MNIFQSIFKVVFLIQIVLWLVISFTYFFSYKAFLYFDFLAVNIMLFLQAPIFIVFVFVVLYNWLLKKKSFIFFKRELYYVLFCIIAMILSGIAQTLCPTCKF